MGPIGSVAMVRLWTSRRFAAMRNLVRYQGITDFACRLPGRLLGSRRRRRRRIFAPAFCTQRAGRALAAPKTPIVLRAALAEITGVRVFADQINQPCPAEIMRELPG